MVRHKVYLLIFFYFFFKQKTAYEMRISDWSSDVCSSDLIPTTRPASQDRRSISILMAFRWPPRAFLQYRCSSTTRRATIISRDEIGRASCRERVCQYV